MKRLKLETSLESCLAGQAAIYGVGVVRGQRC